MHIVFEHSKILPVKSYGGTERVMVFLYKELIKLGHRVSLIGHPQSTVESFGVRLIPKTDLDWRRQIPSDADVAHLFYTPPFELPIPMVVTIAGNGQPGEKFHRNTIFVSKKHAEIHGSDQFVHNAVDPDDYPFNKKILNWSHFMFLAKARWKVKNVKACVKAARMAKKHLHICGGRVFSLSPYIHSYGMLTQEKKFPIFDKADALLFPVRWNEPCAIAIVEALAEGLPVIGSPYGCLPELIGENAGIVCQDEKHLQEVLLHQPRKFDPYDIRHYFEQNFSIWKVAKDYLKAYEKVKAGEFLNVAVPHTVSPFHPETLLPF